MNYGKDYFDEKHPCRCVTCSKKYGTANTHNNPIPEIPALPSTQDSIAQSSDSKNRRKGRHSKEYRIKQKAGQKTTKAEGKAARRNNQDDVEDN